MTSDPPTSSSQQPRSLRLLRFAPGQEDTAALLAQVPDEPGVYVLHSVDPTTGQTSRYEHAGHYTGSAEKSLRRRIAQDLAGKGANLVKVMLRAGLRPELVQVYTGPGATQGFERQLKDRGGAPQYCERCRDELPPRGRMPLAELPLPAREPTSRAAMTTWVSSASARAGVSHGGLARLVGELVGLVARARAEREAGTAGREADPVLAALDDQRRQLDPVAWRTRGWLERAACRGMDVEVFFPEPRDKAGVAAACQVCSGCPVRAECLQQALAGASSRAEDHGVFGGTTPSQRAALRARRLPSPAEYRQDPALAAKALELANGLGSTRSAARVLGVSRGALRGAWAAHGLTGPEIPVGGHRAQITDDPELARELAEHAGRVGVREAARTMGIPLSTAQRALARHQPTVSDAGGDRQGSVGARAAADEAFFTLNPSFARPVGASRPVQRERVRGREEVEALGVRVTTATASENAKLSQFRASSVRRRAEHARTRARHQAAEDGAQARRVQRLAEQTRRQLTTRPGHEPAERDR